MNKGFFKETEEGLYIKIAPWPSKVNPNWCLIKSRQSLQNHTSISESELKKVFDLVSQNITTEKEIKILNVGHNQGEILKIINKTGIKLRFKMDLFGIDPDPKALKKLNFPATLTYDSIAKLKYKACYFDMVVSTNVFEHLILDDLVYLLEETKKILKPTGLLYFEIPNPNSLLAETLDHDWWLNINNMIFTLFSPKRLQIILREIGFTTIHISTKLENNERVNEIREIFLNNGKPFFKFIKNYLKPIRYQLLRHYLLWSNRGSTISVLVKRKEI